MKKAVVFYFSGTGNTYWVAQKIGYGLKERGFRVQTHSIEKTDVLEAIKIAEASDVVGLGYPVYCSDVPAPMQAFIEKFSLALEKPCFVFCTQAGFSGDGGRASLDFMDHLNLKVKWIMHFTMPNNITADCSPLGYRYTPKEMNGILAQADKKAQKLCDYIVENKRCLVGLCKASKVMGDLQRVPYRKYGQKFRNMISFSPKCTHCGYCEKICPTQNITVTPIGNITYNECAYCMRCYNFCPHTAIRIYGKDHNFKRGGTYKGPTRKFKVDGLFKS